MTGWVVQEERPPWDRRAQKKQRRREAAVESGLGRISRSLCPVIVFLCCLKEMQSKSLHYYYRNSPGIGALAWIVVMVRMGGWGVGGLNDVSGE